MLIYLMRHGETNWNKERRLQGQSDIPLNGFGIELAEKTAEAMKNLAIDRAFSSPLIRALETAKIVVGDRKILLETDERLKEINFGESEGIGFEQAREKEENPLHAFFYHPEKYVPTGGAESFQQVAERSESFLEEKIYPLEGKCESVLIVAHGAFNRSILNKVEGIPVEHFWQIELPNCAVSILSLENGQLKLLEESKVYYGEPVNGSPLRK